MKKLSSLVVIVVLAAAFAVAQGPGTGRGQGVSNYNPQTEATITGTVEDVKLEQGKNGNTGTHYMLKTKDGVREVHVGPSSFLKQQGLAAAKGDSVEVIGSATKVNGQDAFIAREVKLAGKSYVLRNAAGKPLWSGGRR